VKTLILLLDFYGHPDLTTDRYSDSVRYSALTEIVSSKDIDKKNCVIFSTNINPRDLKLKELKNIARLNGFKFVLSDHTDNDDTFCINYLKLRLLEINFKLDKDTQVIVTGTNTSGCVFKTKKIGAYHWIKSGYKTKIYLPMCAEYEHKGINDFERNLNGFAQLYKNIKNNKCFEIDICKNFSDLELPFL
tara:strand:+ start:97 stop:666 length:570 start_codon:yes stop_codon:yes gene_type:complete